MWYWEAEVLAKDQTSESWVTSVDVSDPADIAITDDLSFDEYGSVIHATSSAIFVAASDYEADATAITYIDISDPNGTIAERGAITVNGHVADQYKMDAYEGVLRVVSNTGWQSRDVYVTTVDLADPDALAILGETRIEDAAEETLFATRFDGPRAYVVTYFMVDPLFVLDLSDPAAPAVTGELEVPGWSTHIEPQGDRLIALGVDDTDGRQVSVSLFDVSDPTQPGLVDRVSVGEDWAYSTAYNDVKAFTVLDDMIIVPFGGWSEEGAYERLQFIPYNANALELGGHVDLDGSILRSFAYDGFYYGFTTTQLAKINAVNPGNPRVVREITLVEYVAGFVELGADLGVEIVTDAHATTATLRTVDGDGAALGGELEVTLPNFSTAFAYGGGVVLVGADWEGEGAYVVARVDCSDPAEPVTDWRLRVEVPPWWGGGYYYYPAMPDVAVAVSDAEGSGSAVAVDAKQYYDMWYPRTYDLGTAFPTGDILTLWCGEASYNALVGGNKAEQGLALVDLSTGVWTRTIGLGYEWVETIQASGSKLYLSTKEVFTPLFSDRQQCAHFVQEFDPATQEMGPSANVPGALPRL